MKKIFSVMLSFAIMIGIVGTSASLASANGPEENVPDHIVLEGEPGDVVVVGDLIFKCISNDEMDQRISGPVTIASTMRFSNIQLSGTEMSRSFEMTSNYPWAKVWIQNTNDGTIEFTITKGSETGYVVKGSECTIPAKSNWEVWATKEWDPDIYYANFTSGKSGLQGTTSCRVASTQGELDLGYA